MTEPRGPIDWARHYAAAHEQAAADAEAPPELWGEPRWRPIQTIKPAKEYL